MSIKILLRETYTWEYPSTKLLAIQIKQRLQKNPIISYGIDPYYVMLEYVNNYLKQIKDIKQLDIVR
ncbi:MAG: class I adenylate cyclase [Candidatus Baumannia cicadellinicola]|nr:class I adenylate cyclase [Candidatus Baumannia cicadellinicola]